MPRRKRIVIPGEPHHITQRGVRRENIFLESRDRRIYLGLLKKFSYRYGVDIIAYCLMTNHLHHLLVPRDKDSLRLTLQLTHKKYAEYINTRQDWRGHLWQERFYSSPVDEKFFWITLKYIENNPVKAGIVDKASLYPWSSASSHSKGEMHYLANPDSIWSKKIIEEDNWSEELLRKDSQEDINTLVKNTHKDLPCGSENYLDSIEERYKIKVRAVKIGRPKKGEQT